MIVSLMFVNRLGHTRIEYTRWDVLVINFKAISFYFLIFFIALVVFLFAGLPASVAWKMVQGQVPPTVKVSQLSGSVWNGQATAVSNHIPLGKMKVEWEMEPWKLFLATLALDVKVNADNAMLNGKVELGVGSVGVKSLRGRVEPALINTVGRQFKTRIDAPIDLNLQSLTVDLDPKKVRDAQGKVNWEGGNVQYTIAGRRKSSSFPPMTGELSQQGEEAILVVEDPAGKEVIRSRIGDDGWAKLEILKHLVDLSGQPWPGGASPDEVIFEVQEKVF